MKRSHENQLKLSVNNTSKLWVPLSIYIFFIIISIANNEALISVSILNLNNCVGIEYGMDMDSVFRMRVSRI